MASFTHRRPLPYLTDGRGILAATAAIGLTTALFDWALAVTDPTIVALSLLLVVVVVAAVSSWRVAVTTSLLAFLAFNFFFVPPVGTLAVSDAQHGVALFTLLTVSLVASYLSSEVRRRADEVAEAEVARRSAELKSSLLASVGHDLKTPLTAVTIAANNLEASSLTGEERAEQAHIVRVELDRLNHLFQNLIDMARIESHAVTAEREWVQPAEIVEAAAQQVATALALHVLNVDTGSDALLVRLDPRLTSAALAHVLENAAEYSPPGSSIAVTVAIRPGEVRFAVRDHGPGLNPEDAGGPPGAKSPGVTRKRASGSGMGLSISRGLLSAEGGHLSAQNHPDGGALFTLAVPAQRRIAPMLEPEVL